MIELLENPLIHAVAMASVLGALVSFAALMAFSRWIDSGRIGLAIMLLLVLAPVGVIVSMWAVCVTLRDRIARIEAATWRRR